MSASSHSLKSAEYGWPGGDLPGELLFKHAVEPQAKSVLLSCLREVLPGMPEEVEMLALTKPAGIVSRYRLAWKGGDWFVRVSAKIIDAPLEQQITGWLVQHGVSVNHVVVAGLTTQYEGEVYRVDVRPFLHSRHFNGSDEDLHAVAVELRKCHDALATFPDVAEVARRSASRFEMLAGIGEQMREALDSGKWNFFCQDEAWSQQHATWLAEMMRSWRPRLDLEPSAQCLHAQVHQANVMFDLENGRAILVDFEEAVQTLAPPVWDIAYFVQRFALQEEDERRIKNKLGIVRAGYGKESHGVSDMIQQTCWLSMAVLVSYFQQGIVSPLAEYDKFVRLQRQAWRLSSLIDTF